MSATSYFAVRNPKNIPCSFVAPSAYPGTHLAAHTSPRPAKYANKHTKATTSVIVETCFNFTPRTALTSTGTTGATTDSVGIEADFPRLRFTGLADLTRGMVLLPD